MGLITQSGPWGDLLGKTLDECETLPPGLGFDMGPGDVIVRVYDFDERTVTPGDARDYDWNENTVTPKPPPLTLLEKRLSKFKNRVNPLLSVK